ncbi:type II secretion system F family protein [uncultured Ruegeria sp.]|uniref:type II secretion system F family protein n=1 Tax=uncultured Ruegeria sp. TaxID=259304 RepID=UPI00260E2667|nr:type II secretion system F family protein [uncultured Ruegeria sp.]
MMDMLTTAWRRFKFNARSRAETWRLVADLIDSGLMLSDALETAADVAREQRKDTVSAVLLDIREGIPRAEFEERVSRYAPGPEALLFRMVGSAESSRVVRAAMRLAVQSDTLKRAIRTALARPILMLVLVGVVFQMLGTSLYPVLAQTAPMSQWPVVAQWLGAFCIWFSANQWVLLVCIGLVIIGIRILTVRWTKAPRAFFDRFPPFSLYKMQAGIGFMFTVTELGRMGVTLNSALLEEMAADASPYLKSRIGAIAREIRTRSWSDALKATGHDFPARDLNAALGALSGQENWIEKFSGFLDSWIDRFDTVVKERTAILNVVVLAAIAAAMGGTMLSTMSIVQSIQVQ